MLNFYKQKKSIDRQNLMDNPSHLLLVQLNTIKLFYFKFLKIAMHATQNRALLNNILGKIICTPLFVVKNVEFK